MGRGSTRDAPPAAPERRLRYDPRDLGARIVSSRRQNAKPAFEPLAPRPRTAKSGCGYQQRPGATTMASLRPAFNTLLEHLDAGRFGAALDAMETLRHGTWEQRREVFDLDVPCTRDAGPRSDARWWSAWTIVALAQAWPDVAQRSAEWALAADSQLGFAHYLRARALRKTAQRKSAHTPELFAEIAVELDEALAHGFVDARVFHAQLDLALERDDHATAASVAQALLQFEPADAKARKVRTESLVRLGQAARASDELEALEPELRSQATIAQLGAWAAMRCGRHAVAEQTLATAIERWPDSWTLVEQQLEVWKARRGWYRLLIQKDLWLDRQGKLGRHIQCLAAAAPLWIALSGWVFIFCAALTTSAGSSAVKQAAGWVALAVAATLGVYAFVESQDATNWWRWLWRDPATLFLFRHRDGWPHAELFLAMALGGGALLASLVGLLGLGVTLCALAILAFGTVPFWTEARGWRRLAASMLVLLGIVPIVWAVAPLYLGLAHPLSDRLGLLLGLAASLLACGLLVARLAPRWVLVTPATGVIVLTTYLAGVLLGLDSTWWELLGLVAVLAAVSGGVCLMVAVDGPIPEEPP